MRIRVLNPSAQLPVGILTVKDHLRIVGNDENSYLSNLIVVAGDWAEHYLNKHLISKQIRVYLDGFSSEIIVKLYPLQSIDAVAYYDSDNVRQVLTASDYDADEIDGRLSSFGGWPATYDKYNAVEIDITVGYGDFHAQLPRSIQQAMLLLIGHLYENREDTTDLKLKQLPMGAKALLSPFRDPSI